MNGLDKLCRALKHKTRQPNNLPPRPLAGFLYIVQCADSNYYKIGITSSLVGAQSRLAVLQVGCPFELNCVSVIKLKNYKAEEKDIHKALLHKRIRGEWFELNRDDLSRIINSLNK